MMTSCSAWIVATMSLIWPVRDSFSAASSVASPVRDSLRDTSAELMSSTSSSRPMTLRERVRRCRRRRTPSGEAAVAR